MVSPGSCVGAAVRTRRGLGLRRPRGSACPICRLRKSVFDGNRQVAGVGVSSEVSNHGPAFGLTVTDFLGHRSRSTRPHPPSAELFRDEEVNKQGARSSTADEQPLSWDDFVRAVQQSLYKADPGRLAVYQRGVAGGPSVEFSISWWISCSRQLRVRSPAQLPPNVHPRQLLNEVKHARRRQIAEKLRKRNFTGERLLRVLTRYPEWDAKQLERLFEFTELEAIRVLVNAGYQPGEDGFWRRSDTPDEEHRRQALDQFEQRMWDGFGP